MLGDKSDHRGRLPGTGVESCEGANRGGKRTEKRGTGLLESAELLAPSPGEAAFRAGELDARHRLRVRATRRSGW